ncbi:MAG: histidinol-phosphatase HisJ family protein [Bdellovibrionota bacterium]|jgi:histidinol-phosphatase (PHP family)
MSIKVDYHLHTNFSADSTEPMENMVKRAIELRLEQICFTEHIDYDYPLDEGVIFETDLEAYFAEVDRLRGIYGAKIEILRGIELGLVPHLAERYSNLINAYHFDFIIGSSHLLDMRDPYERSFWRDRSEEEVITRYFQSIVENIKAFSGFNVYGHLDYIVRYAPHKNEGYSYAKYATLIDQVLTALIERGKGIEINTSGFLYGLNTPHPNFDIIKRYKELGGELITVGSDAHRAADIAAFFEIIFEQLKAVGFKGYTVFNGGKAQVISF